MAADFWIFFAVTGDERSTVHRPTIKSTFEQSYSFNEQWVKEYEHIFKLLDLIWLPIIQNRNKNLWHYLTITISFWDKEPLII